MLRACPKLVPEDPDLFYNLGSLYFQTNQDQLAFECLSSTILLKPDHFDANQLAGVTMTLHGDYDVALNKYRSIVKQSSENSILWNNIGVALMVILNCANFLIKSNKRLAYQLFMKYEKCISTMNELTLPYWINKNDIDKLVTHLKTQLGRIESHQTSELLDT
ncbi:hypothetical protein MN116_005463 [Schistosoma mekongi]|uniref:Bardet-Biedl syndrome 4 protein n=1 Tax=Schistosoma mekongi TaxID=38744 RepID=A0AAE1ZE96_SCHME|nr:hypothetical protein MN116_005463 [Schistosoma mekongi]